MPLYHISYLYLHVLVQRHSHKNSKNKKTINHFFSIIGTLFYIVSLNAHPFYSISINFKFFIILPIIHLNELDSFFSYSVFGYSLLYFFPAKFPPYNRMHPTIISTSYVTFVTQDKKRSC